MTTADKLYVAKRSVVIACIIAIIFSMARHPVVHGRNANAYMTWHNHNDHPCDEGGRRRPLFKTGGYRRYSFDIYHYIFDLQVLFLAPLRLILLPWE
jgi:hypothetical protein